MKKILLLLLLVFSGKTQILVNKALQFGGGGSSVVISAIKQDKNFNYYVLGDYDLNIDVDPGTGTYNISNASTTGGFASFLVKLDSSGNFLWATNFTGDDDVTVYGLAVDDSENVYLAGSFLGTINFGNNSNVSVYTPFLLKLDAQGNQVWFRDFFASQDAEIYSLSMDDAANLYVCGYLSGILKPGNNISFTANNSLDGFVLKLDSSGVPLWGYSLTSQGDNEALLTHLTSNNHLYIAGVFNDTVDFSNGQNLLTLTSNGEDIFLLKIDTAGNFILAKQWGTQGSEIPTAITSDLNENVFIAGYFSDSFDIDPSNTAVPLHNYGTGSDCFIAKFSPNLDSLSGYSQIKNSTHTLIYQLERISTDKIMVAGEFQDSLFFPGNDSVISLGNSLDGFLALYDTSLNFINHYELQTPNGDLFQVVGKNHKSEMILGGTLGGSYSFQPQFPVTPKGFEDGILLFAYRDTTTTHLKNSEALPVSFYPNPTSNQIFLEVRRPIAFKILSLQGQELLSGKCSQTSSIDLSELPQGIYLLQVRDNNQEKYFKLIKQ